ncbi:MAG TPA: hypothetical protein VKB34_10695 [Povalibacter sp.]|nr:hypothetical protein [Povalibacter sp.]
MHRFQHVAMAALLASALAAPVAAQQNNSPVSPADIQRLQESANQAAADIQQLRGRDASRATQLQTQLDDLREETIYLKVKLRKEGTLARSEYATVRDRIDDLRSEATNASAPAQPAANRAASTAAAAPATSQAAAAPRTTAPAANAANTVEVPSGTELDVRLTNALNSGTAQVEDRFEGTTLVDLNIGGKTVIPAGSVMRGVITAVDPATRTNRTGKMTVSFDQVTVNGRAYPVRGTVTQAIEGEGIKGETGRIATGAGVGAILGGILGGFKGALAGILIGGGGTIAATEGKQVELPQGSVLRVRLDSPVTIQAAR